MESSDDLVLPGDDTINVYGKDIWIDGGIDD